MFCVYALNRVTCAYRERESAAPSPPRPRRPAAPRARRRPRERRPEWRARAVRCGVSLELDEPRFLHFRLYFRESAESVWGREYRLSRLFVSEDTESLSTCRRV